MVADCEYTPDEDNNNSTVDNGDNGDNGSSDQEPTIPLMRLPQLSLRFPPRSSTGKALLSIVISALILSTNVNLLTIRGFLIFDHLKDRAKFEKDVSKWIKEGKLQWKETVVQGLENSPEAFANLLEGKNIGKMLIKI